MANIAVIGGSGLDELATMSNAREIRRVTRFGMPSDSILEGRFADQKIYFLARHGRNHAIPPHQINYRANISALADLGVEDVIAVTAVGGITEATPPRRIVIPDQIIDYTYSREQTFSDGLDNAVNHIDFTYPYSSRLRDSLVSVAATINLPLEPTGTYGTTQGPRLETAAEITRMKRDGCTIVGMTGMPEAGLAREAGLNYANISLVVNWAAGIVQGTIDVSEIEGHLAGGITDVLRLTEAWLRNGDR
jgi:5'-methylthioinosine phosphorylase